MAIFDPGPQPISDYISDLNRLIISLNQSDSLSLPLVLRPSGAADMLASLNQVVQGLNKAGISVPYFTGPQDTSAFLSLINTLNILGGSAPFTPVPAAAAIFAAMTTPPTPARQVLINNTVVSLQAAGIWSKLDILYKLNAHDAQAASLNWINPSAFPLTVVGSPIFTPDLGYKGNGTTDALSTGYNPTLNAINVSQDSISVFANSLEQVRTDSKPIFGIGGTHAAYLNPWNSSVNSFSSAANSAGENPVPPLSGVGLFLANRTGSANYRVSQNGTLLTTVTAASVTVPNVVVRILGTTGGITNFSQRLVNCAGMGGGLTPTQEVQFNNIMQAYDAGVAAIINNYNNTGAYATNLINNSMPFAQISHHDDQGNMVDAHAGNWLQVGNKVYMYGEGHDSGYHPGTAGSASSGVKIYSNDLNAWGPWHYEGVAFDVTQAPWPARLTTQNGNYMGLYAPKVIYNAKNNNYVLWFYNQLASSAVEYVFTHSSPTFGATPTTPGNPTLLGTVTFPTTNPGTPSFYVEPNGVNAYCVYSDLNAGYAVNVIALNSDFTALSGAPVNTGGVGEGNGIFEYGGNTYVMYGTSGCAYCTTVNTFVRMAPSPLGTYGAEQRINDTTNVGSCQSQTRDVAQITWNGVTTTFLLLDQWWAPGTFYAGQRANQGLANFYVVPLIFNSSGAIQSYFANPTAMIPGAKMGPAPTTPTVNPDQVCYGDVFQDYCDITATNQRMQTFVPTRTTLATFETPLCRNNPASQVGASTWGTPDGSLIAELVTLDGSNNPVTVVGSVTVAATGLSYATKWTALNFNVAVTPGTPYGIRFRGTNTVGAFGITMTGGGIAPYSNGVERVWTQLATPVNAAFSTATTGGSLAAATYYYRVSAINANGETLASTETSQVVPAGTATNTVTVNWGAVAGATGYKVYGRSTGAELLIATVGAVTTYTDTGSVTPAGALPAINSTAAWTTEAGRSLMFSTT